MATWQVVILTWAGTGNSEVYRMDVMQTRYIKDAGGLPWMLLYMTSKSRPPHCFEDL